MASEKHTPGPWAVGPNPSGHPNLVVSTGDLIVCDLPPMHEAPDALRRANAHLIAAAPELKKALQLFMTCFPAAIMALNDEQQQLIRGAFAKAEGKELSPTGAPV